MTNLVGRYHLVVWVNLIGQCRRIRHHMVYRKSIGQTTTSPRRTPDELQLTIRQNYQIMCYHRPDSQLELSDNVLSPAKQSVSWSIRGSATELVSVNRLVGQSVRWSASRPVRLTMDSGAVEARFTVGTVGGSGWCVCTELTFPRSFICFGALVARRTDGTGRL